MSVGLLVQLQLGEGLRQTEILGKLTPKDQQRMLSQGAGGRYVHGSSSRV
jgi:hypothetical protein